MGSDHGLPLEQPVHTVSIGKPFWIATTLVTQGAWEAVLPENPSRFQDSLDLPVDSVSYDQALAFCSKASEISDVGLTLPTEAQWEYACRSGVDTEFFWGTSADEAKSYGWFESNARDRTHEVGLLKANPWGLFDIVGNLWEWCDDVWHSDYQNAPTDGAPWLTEEARQPRRCLRGGAWDMDVFRLRSAYRSFDHRELGTSRFGMQLVLTE